MFYEVVRSAVVEANSPEEAVSKVVVFESKVVVMELPTYRVQPHRTVTERPPANPAGSIHILREGWAPTSRANLKTQKRLARAVSAQRPS